MTTSRGPLALLAATVAVTATLGAACSKKEVTSDIPGTTTTAVVATTEAPATTQSPGTTRTPGTTAPRRTTTSRAQTNISADDLGGIDPTVFADLPDDAPYGRFVTERDATDAIAVDIPATWETDTKVRTITGVTVPSIVASLDLQDYYDNRTTPGMRFAAYQGELRSKGAAWALQHEGEVDKLDQCTGSPQAFPFEDKDYSGQAQVTTGCGVNNDVTVVQIAASDKQGTGDLAVLGVSLTSQADVAALQRVIASFKVPSS